MSNKEKNIDYTIQLSRLTRCIERLAAFYVHEAPTVIKKAELSVIKTICNELESNLEENND